MLRAGRWYADKDEERFNRHPPLGVNATLMYTQLMLSVVLLFQWAPTLRGECYVVVMPYRFLMIGRFNGHPPLGVNATVGKSLGKAAIVSSFNGHPPLGVNATNAGARTPENGLTVSMGTHP